ncbi:MAG: 50S ribosomal protein L11 methyltransferase, partial [Verrucomicrobiota bacterium]
MPTGIGERNLELMYRWTHRISPEERQKWEERLERDSMLGILLEEEGRSQEGKEYRVTGFFETWAEGKRYQAEFGGEVSEVDPDDWVKESQKRMEGEHALFGKKFLVVWDPSTEEAKRLGELHPERELLHIPPECAFGTGDHETTSHCLRSLEQFAGDREGECWA